jgi:heterotetrameric sarcosine oxidase gamma subunit
VGMGDISAFAKFSLLGAQVGHEWASRRQEVAAFDAGGPTLACRLRADHLWLLASTPDPAGIRNRLANLSESCALTDVTSAYAGFSLVGPALAGVLRRVTPLDVSNTAFPHGSCAETSLAGVHALIVKPPASALPVARIYLAWDVAEYVWERLSANSRGVDLAIIGMEAITQLSS